MRPAFVSDIKTYADLAHYDLRMWIDTEAGVLTGTEQLSFSNRTSAPLGDIALRLYPNFPADVFGKGGDVRMEVSSAAVAGQSAEVHYAAQQTAVLLALPRPLDPGAATTLSVTYTATLRPWRDGTWPLPSYYPMLAAHDSSGWRLDVTTFADHVYAESALYAAEITAPANLSVIASGTTIATQAYDDRSTTHIVRSGPVREFALTVGAFSATQAVAGTNGDVTVNVYTARRSRLDVQQIADLAAAALTDFDRRFGPYPYAELDIQLLPYDFDGGDEYPGFILLYSDGQVDAGTRYVAAHEVAHQWWYCVVGNDIYHTPWLDEALAQYSGIIYDEDIAGAAVAEIDWEREVLRRYRGALDDGDLPIGLGIDDYPSFNGYYRTIYGKGAVFLGTLREQLGDEAFFKGLQIYYQSQRYQVATTQDIQRAFEQASGRDLAAIFGKWVNGTNT
jgi:aminopeptidase N